MLLHLTHLNPSRALVFCSPPATPRQWTVGTPLRRSNPYSFHLVLQEVGRAGGWWLTVVG